MSSTTTSGHKGKITAVKFGRKSAGMLLVTGGTDQRVCVWMLGATTPIMPLSGLGSTVSTVALSSAEDHALAGSLLGNVRMWDLSHGEAVRTFATGPSAKPVPVAAVESHPTDHFVASSGRDGVVRVWDVRQKACIQNHRLAASTFAGQLMFSPDGRLLLAGKQDGNAEIFDLATGKSLKTLVVSDHNAPVTSLAIHPTEFLLGTASKDGCVKLWDLETFECTSSGQETRPTAASDFDYHLRFAADGQSLYAISGEHVSMLGWEPYGVRNKWTTSWLAPADVAVDWANNCLIGASIVGDTLQMSKFSLSSVGTSAAKESSPAASSAPAAPAQPPAVKQISVSAASRASPSPVKSRLSSIRPPVSKPVVTAGRTASTSSPRKSSVFSDPAPSNAVSSPTPTAVTTRPLKHSPPPANVSNTRGGWEDKPMFDSPRSPLRPNNGSTLFELPAERKSNPIEDSINRQAIQHSSATALLRQRLALTKRITGLWFEGNIKEALMTIGEQIKQEPGVGIPAAYDLISALVESGLAGESWLAQGELWPYFLPIAAKLLSAQPAEVSEDTYCINALFAAKTMSAAIAYESTRTAEDAVGTLPQAQSQLDGLKSSVEKLKRKPGKTGILAREFLKALVK